MADREWFIDAYDRIVEEAGDDGLDVGKAKDAVAQAYADAVETGEIDPVGRSPIEEGHLYAEKWINGTRTTRKAGLRRSMQEILDALSGETILGTEDPYLAQAFALGDGRDKTLRAWTEDDWQIAIVERYRNAAEVTAAAAEFDALARQIIDRLHARGVRTTGDLT